MRWCCLSEPEMLKCKQLANVTSQVVSFASVTCIYGGSSTSCMSMVANRSADVITLGEELIYQAGMLCLPVELYNLYNLYFFSNCFRNLLLRIKPEINHTSWCSLISKDARKHSSFLCRSRV